MQTSWLRPVLLLAAFSILAGCSGRGVPLAVESRRQGSTNQLWLDPIGNFYSTGHEVRNLDAFGVPGSSILVSTWEENVDANRWSPFFAISLDGQQVATARETSAELLLRYGNFDPLVAGAAQGEPDPLTEVRIVQFKTQILAEYRAQLEATGARIYRFLANNALVVNAPVYAASQIAKQPYVRWMGPYRLEYKFDPPLLAKLSNQSDVSPTTYRIEVFERGLDQQNLVAQQVGEIGGRLDATIPQGFFLQATLAPDQVLQVASLDEVAHIDEWGPPQADDVEVRDIGGADYLEQSVGFTGQGVRAEVLDVGTRVSHNEFQAIPLLRHNDLTSGDHGTSTTGINFASGVNPDARGIVPDAQGIASTVLTFPMPNRYRHTTELLNDPFFAVYQSNSWGGNLTTQYTTETAEMDDIIFNLDFLITQSQSNAGSQQSRPQAWAKNIVSVGGILHCNPTCTEDMSLHRWGHSGSIGPAADGRIKPDLAHFYDGVYSPSGVSDSSYNSSFGGTSAATPIVAGYFGLFFQMWHNGLFGNPTGNSVFDSRPHETTARAFVINTALQWDFQGETDDRTRVHQGWGLPSVANLYDLSSQIYFVDETDVILPLQTNEYQVEVVADTPALKATMIYKDPMGTTSSTLHRINDLDLMLTSPSGEVYWGNNGLRQGVFSQPGGNPDPLDTVENIFVPDPEVGTWTVDVYAREINQDCHLQTEELDCDYALVVSGVVVQTANGPVKRSGQ